MRGVVAFAAVAAVVGSAFALAYRFVADDWNGVGARQKFWCGEYLDSVFSEADRLRLASWADAEIFAREFVEGDFRLGHFAGPRVASRTLDSRKSDVRLPDWMPSDYEIRTLGDGKFHSIFITGGRYRGLIVVRSGWDEALDGKHLTASMITARRGRVGLICYVD
jgi:hypothetical protein